MNTWVKKKKLTKANSFMAGERIFYIAKKLNDESTAKLYWAYLYPHGFAVRGADTKDKLFKWLEDNSDIIEKKCIEKGLK